VLFEEAFTANDHVLLEQHPHFIRQDRILLAKGGHP
jgi:hypothetical protein